MWYAPSDFAMVVWGRFTEGSNPKFRSILKVQNSQTATNLGIAEAVGMLGMFEEILFNIKSHATAAQLAVH